METDATSVAVSLDGSVLELFGGSLVSYISVGLLLLYDNDILR